MKKKIIEKQMKLQDKLNPRPTPTRIEVELILSKLPLSIFGGDD